MEVLQLLRELNETDEHTKLEAKAVRNSVGRTVLETVCSFSNEPGLGGGTILLGVEQIERTLFPTYEAVGISDPDKIQSEVATQCADMFNRPIRPRITPSVLKHRQIIVVEVAEARPNEKPIFFKKDGLPGGAYRRISSTDQQCTIDDLAVFYHDRSVTGFDEEIVPDASMSHIDHEAVEIYRKALGQSEPNAEILKLDDNGLLVSVGCAKESDGRLLPTIAGLILFGTGPALRQFFPSMRIDYIVSHSREWIQNPGDSMNVIEIREALVRAIPRLWSLVIGDIPTSPQFSEAQIQRTDVSMVPARVVREALVNALMHRSYREHSPAMVIRYPNRLEVRNPGYSLKSDDLFGKPGSEQRNPKIATVLHELRMAETRGMGIGLMQRIMTEAGLAPPYLESNRPGNVFSAFFMFHHFFGPEDLAALARFKGLRLEDDEPRALVFARELGAIDNAAFRTLSGLDAVGASSHLRRLTVHGLLKRKSHGSRAYYVPTDKLLSAWETASDSPETPSKPAELVQNSTGTPQKPAESPALESVSGAWDEPDETKATAFPALPSHLQKVISGLPRRLGTRRMRRVILMLCAWKPLKAIEIAAYLGYKAPSYIRSAYLNPLLDQKLLAVTTESINNPNLSYVTTNTGTQLLDRTSRKHGADDAGPIGSFDDLSDIDA